MKRTHGRHTGNWRLTAAILGLALLVLAEAAAAQVYKWKDEHGATHYGDAPPPRVKSELLETDKQTPVQAPILPDELARAAQAAPVVLYTTARCDACDQGRALLRARGIPFSERTVNTAQDQQQLQQAGGGKNELPLLLVGSRTMTGFQAAAWQEALTSAAYPRQKMLPPTYQFAAPVPAAGSASAAAPTAPVRGQIKMPPDDAAAQAAEQQPRNKQPPPSSTPPTH
jgi:glutaredoxin